ncbi:MAG TPA: hypothetical protein VFH61_09965 [Thermoleophilia bacterium]|nr:hypothetical protein [Thermoleophilia bacterium]
MPDTRREYSYDDLFPERWLHAPDLDGRTVTLKIIDLYAETIVNPKTKKGDECGIVSFDKTKREYVLSKQNAWILKTVFGPTKDDVDGKRITISPVPDSSGFTEHGIRILFTGSPDIDADMRLTLPGGARVIFKKTKVAKAATVQEGDVDAVTGEVTQPAGDTQAGQNGDDTHDAETSTTQARFDEAGEIS